MSSKIKFNVLNQTITNDTGAPDLESTTLERLRRVVAKYENDDKKEVKEYLGVVCSTRWVATPSDGFTEKEVEDLLHTGENEPEGYIKCIVRIPELHACIPEPQAPTYNKGDPAFDDFYIHMHDEFFVQKGVGAPMPGDIVVCDYKYRDIRKGGTILAVHKDKSGAGGAMISSESRKSAKKVFEAQQKNLPRADYATKSIKPSYDSKSSKQLGRDDEILKSLHPRFEQKVIDILKKLRKEYPGAVITSAWRSVVRQRTLSAKTNTGLSFSYHITIAEPDDSDYYVPVARAIDVSIDLPDVNPNPPPKDATPLPSPKDAFFLKLGKLVKDAGLTWGGDFRVRPSDKEKIHNRWKNFGIGWDPVHFTDKNRINRAEKKKLKDETGRIYNRLGIKNSIKG